MVTFAFPVRLSLAASLVVLVSAAQAQTTTQPTPPTPYATAFKDYKPYTDEPVTSWKAANDEVARIGGWREYAKQAQQPENTPATKAGDVKPKATP